MNELNDDEYDDIKLRDLVEPIEARRCPVCGSEIRVEFRDNFAYIPGWTRAIMLCSNPECMPYEADLNGEKTMSYMVSHYDFIKDQLSHNWTQEKFEMALKNLHYLRMVRYLRERE